MRKDMYDIRDLMKLSDEELEELGIGKEEISEKLDEEAEWDPEYVEFYRYKYGY